jgi:hypothetical protein
MAGVKGKSGRHTGAMKREGYYFRLRPEVINRVDRCTPLLELKEGVRMSKAEALEYLLTMACTAVEGKREGKEAPAHTSISEILEISSHKRSELSAISNGTPPAYDDRLVCLGDEEEEEMVVLPVDMPQAVETPEPLADTQPASASPVNGQEVPGPEKTLPRAATGMQNCDAGKGHPPYPITMSECRKCRKARNSRDLRTREKAKRQGQPA